MSEIRANTVSNAAGTGPATLTGQYAAKAWVNFNGANNPVSIRDSGNVSSITDHGAGDYTVNFTNALSSSNYSTVAAGGQENTQWGIYLGAPSYGSTTTGHRFNNVTSGGVLVDTTFNSLAFIE